MNAATATLLACVGATGLLLMWATAGNPIATPRPPRPYMHLYGESRRLPDMPSKLSSRILDAIEQSNGDIIVRVEVQNHTLSRIGIVWPKGTGSALGNCLGEPFYYYFLWTRLTQQRPQRVVFPGEVSNDDPRLRKAVMIESQGSIIIPFLFPSDTQPYLADHPILTLIYIRFDEADIFGARARKVLPPWSSSLESPPFTLPKLKEWTPSPVPEPDNH